MDDKVRKLINALERRSGWKFKVLGRQTDGTQTVILSLEKPIMNLVEERRVRIEIPKADLEKNLSKGVALAVLNSCKKVSPRGLTVGGTVSHLSQESVTIQIG